MAFEDGRIYGANNDGSDASIGAQINPNYFYKKALIELVKERYFGQLADVRSMPKHMGKTIKQFHYLPLLDDRNINDQGIDADGVVTLNEVTIEVVGVNPDVAAGGDGVGFLAPTYYFVGNGVDAAAALGATTITEATATTPALAASARLKTLAWMASLGYTGGTDQYSDLKTLAEADGWVFTEHTAQEGSGNMYGSSKDVGYISGKMPALSENGGRVNRVGFKRIQLEATIEKFGFFDEYTQESMDFDTDSELMSHISQETLRGANEITEDALQLDLLNAANVVLFAGDATSVATLSGTTTKTTADDSAPAGTAVSGKLSYDNLAKLAIELDNNRCPKATKIITGSRMVDTKVVGATRYMYIGSELQTSLEKMTDYHGNKAYIEVQHYASAGTVAAGEAGSIGKFKFIVVPEMMHWSGVGAAVGTNGGFRSSNVDGAEKYDVFPALVVGSGSFTTIGFQTDGKTVKFKITHKKPGRETADRNDPYGETGFYSIKWYYGFMVLRPEWIGIVKCLAEI